MEIKNGIIVANKDGKIVGNYKNMKDAADAYGITTSTVAYRIKTGKFYEGYLFMKGTYTSTSEEDFRKRSTIPDDFELPLLDYEEKHRICYTPCPHKRDIKIGSVLCQGCSSFKGMDRENHKLACGKKTL